MRSIYNMLFNEKKQVTKQHVWCNQYSENVFNSTKKINLGEPFPDKKVKVHKIVNYGQITHC